MLDKFVVAIDATIELIHILLKKSSVDFPLVSDSQSIVLFIYKLFISICASKLLELVEFLKLKLTSLRPDGISLSRNVENLMDNNFVVEIYTYFFIEISLLLGFVKSLYQSLVLGVFLLNITSNLKCITIFI